LIAGIVAPVAAQAKYTDDSVSLRLPATFSCIAFLLALCNPSVEEIGLRDIAAFEDELRPPA